MVSFSDLLNKPADDIKRPKVLPEGTYLGIVKSYQLLESKEKKTPYVEYQVGITAPGDGIDPESLVGVDMSGKTLRKSFFITNDALYRLKEFIESCHIETKGRTLGELIPQTVNQPVLVGITQRPGRDGSGDFFNDVGALRGQP